MQILLTSLAILLFSCTAVPARAADAVAVGQNTTAVIEGVIRGSNLSLVESVLSKSNTGILDLVIDSPGGSVTTGFHFVSEMEAAKGRGTTIRCFVPHLAASMAFQILLHCNERYVLDRSFLLWHRARIMMGGMGGSPLTAPQMFVLGRSLQDDDDIIYREVSDTIVGMSQKELRYHFENETLHIGEKLASSSPTFTSYPSIPGLLEALADGSLPRSIREDEPLFQFGEVIYISPLYQIFGSSTNHWKGTK